MIPEKKGNYEEIKILKYDFDETSYFFDEFCITLGFWVQNMLISSTNDF